MLHRLLAGVISASWLCGCGGDNGLNCESSERYSGAGSVTPVRVPDDLNPPDETDSLRLPPPRDAAPLDSASAAATPRGCLESPPDFFEEGRPGAAQPAGRDDDSERAISN